MSESDNRPRLVVGVGASAGGIEACKALLQAVPADSNLAFIVVMHLDPRRGSHIAEILQRGNRHLSFVQAQGSEKLTANCVYVIAPNSKLSLVDGTLDVETLGQNETRSSLVDFLFSSLADADGERAVGIVLSGAGQDGTRGLQSIRKAGGFCLAQDPATASSRSMPQSAIDAGLADAVLPPAEIPAVLLAFAEHDIRPARRAASTVNDHGPSAEPHRSDDNAPEGFQRILTALGEVADVSFDDYKVGTLERRTRRRMGLKQIDDFEEYADRLGADREELDALYHDVLIGVTQFFRDPDVWVQLGEELSAVLQQRETPGLRAWIPGCGTGEEAYTLAILACERLTAKEHSKVQIYATDLNGRALAIARRGIYPAGALEHLGQARREAYFNQYNGQLQVDRGIRDCVTFAPHNVLSDPPFSNMDVVSCRNVLIYLKPQAHDRLLKRLHFALRRSGLLMLGRAERLGRQGKLFEEVSKQHSIFRARMISHDERFQVTPRTRERARMPAVEPPMAPLPGMRPSPEASTTGPARRIEQYVLRYHTPAAVVINAQGEIQHLYGQTDRYLVPPTGESRQDLLAWLRPGFYIRLRSALRQAVDRGEREDTEGQIERNDQLQRVRASIEPLPSALGDDGLFLVIFRDVAGAERSPIDAADNDEPVVRELEQDLLDTRRELQATIEQLEAAGEEHRASHEELLSLNEELQSSNEELEASKEELEALNEEMNTINGELEQKNTELREANNDLYNLFLSTGIPTLFLDRELRIRRYTEVATEVLRLVPSDIGRSIEHIKERFDDGGTANKCRQVLETLEPLADAVRTADGRTFMRRILPYRTDEREVEGICITFTDVSEQKQAAEQSEAARDYAEAIVRTVRTPLLVLDEGLRIVSMNNAFRADFGTNDEILGQPLSVVRDKQWNIPKLDELLAPVVSEGAAVDDYEVSSRNRTIVLNARRVDYGGDGARIVLSFEDVTHHRRAHEQSEQRAIELREDAKRKDQWIAMLGHELRNPVGAVGNGIELLRKTSLASDQQAQVVGMMDRQLRHVADLLDELLDAARIVAGKLDVEREPVDLTKVSEWALDTVGRLMQERHHTVTSDLPPEGTVWVEGDRVRLTEVLGNLLTNAAKYTEEGGEIHLAISAGADTVAIRVRDNGVGISAELRDHIFEMFTQGPRTLGRADRGLGLGLPLVRSLVGAHGGQVEVFSEGPGKGSEFYITLPRMTDIAAADARQEEQPVKTPPRRILIVDDVRDAAESLALLLRGQGHEIRTAGDGLEALKALRDFEPDCALLDLGLPGMDGYELARRLRDERLGAVLIAVTGYQKNTADLTAAGFDHHLLKPIDMEQLSRMLADEQTRRDS